MENLRCCQCPKSENETDVLDSGSSNHCFEEEFAVEEDTINCQKMKLDLLCMRTVIDKYQSKLKSFLDVCPEEPCIDFETELTCSKNKEICDLQRSLHKLECQVKELVDCCKIAKQELKNLHFLTCQKSQEIYALQKHAASLESWRRTLQLEAGLCIERFEFLKTVKAEWSEVVDMLEKDKECFSITEKKLVSRKCYVKDKKYFISEIDKLKQMFRELYELQNTQFVFGQTADTPTCLSELKLAEKEYITLKAKFNKAKYENERDEEKNDCK